MRVPQKLRRIRSHRDAQRTIDYMVKHGFDGTDVADMLDNVQVESVAGGGSGSDGGVLPPPPPEVWDFREDVEPLDAPQPVNVNIRRVVDNFID